MTVAEPVERKSKRKITLSLDDEALAILERDNDIHGSVSAMVNELLVAKVDWLRRREALQTIVDEYVEECGPLDETLLDEFRQAMA